MEEIIIKYGTDELKTLINLMLDDNDFELLRILHETKNDLQLFYEIIANYLYEQLITHAKFDDNIVYQLKNQVFQIRRVVENITLLIIAKSITENTFDYIITKIPPVMLLHTVNDLNENILRHILNNEIDCELFETIIFKSDQLFEEYLDQFIQLYKISDATFLYNDMYKIRKLSPCKIKALLSRDIIPQIRFIHRIIGKRQCEYLKLLAEYQIDISNIYKKVSKNDEFTNILSSFNVDLIDYFNVENRLLIKN
jgi:hypothetical protein